MRTILAWLVCVVLTVITFSPGCAIAGSVVFGFRLVPGAKPVDPVFAAVCGFIAWLTAVLVIAKAIDHTRGLWCLAWLLSVGVAAFAVMHALLIACYPHLGVRLAAPVRRVARWEEWMSLWFASLAFISVALLFLTQLTREDGTDDETPVTVEPIDEGPAPTHQQQAPLSSSRKTHPLPRDLTKAGKETPGHDARQSQPDDKPVTIYGAGLKGWKGKTKPKN